MNNVMGTNTNGEQRECAVDEHRNACQETGDGYLESRGSNKQAGVGKQRDVGTTANGPSPTVDAANDTIPKQLAAPGRTTSARGVRGLPCAPSGATSPRIWELPRANSRAPTAPTLQERQGM